MISNFFFTSIILLIYSFTNLMAQDIKYYNLNDEHFADITVNNLTFNARVGGLDNDGDPIILLHGFPETSRMWKDLISNLNSNDFRVVAPDQRGYSPGARPKGIDSYKIDYLAKDIIDIANKLGFEKFHLAGHDWGSAVGWYIASAYPERLLSWTALSVPHMDAFINAMDNDKIQKRKSSYISFFTKPLLPELYFKIFNYKNLKSIWTHSPDDEINDYIDVFSQKNALKTSLHWYRANLSGKGEKIGRISVPTLMIAGLKDMAVGQVAVRNTESYMEGPYTLKEMDAGHWLIQESFDEVSELIISHLKENKN